MQAEQLTLPYGNKVTVYANMLVNSFVLLMHLRYISNDDGAWKTVYPDMLFEHPRRFSFQRANHLRLLVKKEKPLHLAAR